MLRLLVAVQPIEPEVATKAAAAAAERDDAAGRERSSVQGPISVTDVRARGAAIATNANSLIEQLMQVDQPEAIDQVEARLRRQFASLSRDELLGLQTVLVVECEDKRPSGPPCPEAALVAKRQVEQALAQADRDEERARWIWGLVIAAATCAVTLAAALVGRRRS